MTDPDRQPELSWRAHPARESRGRALAALAAVTTLAGLSGLLMQSWWWAAAAAFALVIALNRFFLPSEFAIDDEGVTAWYPFRRQRLAWSGIRRFACGVRGGLLSPRARPSWFDTRSVHVLFGAHREQVCACIRAHLSSHGGTTWAS